jgi:hypothetical protein
MRGAAMSADTKGLDDWMHCKCGQTFEIAAVRLSIFRKTEILWRCPGCGLERDELRSKARKRIRDRIAMLNQKLSILRKGAIPRRPVESRSAHKQRQQ